MGGILHLLQKDLNALAQKKEQSTIETRKAEIAQEIEQKEKEKKNLEGRVEGLGKPVESFKILELFASMKF